MQGEYVFDAPIGAALRKDRVQHQSFSTTALRFLSLGASTTHSPLKMLVMLCLAAETAVSAARLVDASAPRERYRSHSRRARAISFFPTRRSSRLIFRLKNRCYVALENETPVSSPRLVDARTPAAKPVLSEAARDAVDCRYAA